MKAFQVTWVVVLAMALSKSAMSDPVTINGDAFTLVANGPGTAQLFALTSDTNGRVYIGNNSNDTVGIPVQLFDPSLFSGMPIPLQNFGPAVGDADGIAFGGGFIFAPDRDEGLRRTAVSNQTSSIFVSGVSINPTGSPVVYRPSDAHVFIGFGSLPEVPRIDEYDASGVFVRTFTTAAAAETMTFDRDSGLIYYAPFGTEVRSFDPLTGTDKHVGDSSGFIDGGLTFDSITGLLFVGTANGTNSGLVETINPITGERKSFASGFNGCLGILREPISGDLYFLEANRLYRLNSAQVIGPARLQNISTRLEVLTGDNVGIAGFIIGGTGAKRILIRGLGPTVGRPPFNVPSILADPELVLHTTDAQGHDVILSTNDNWQTSDQNGQSQEAEIASTGLAPGDPAEAAIFATLNPGAYTAIIQGRNNGTGNALVDAFDLDPSSSSSFLTNISTRGFANTGDQVIIGGFILGPSTAGNATLLVRVLGPTLAQPPFNVSGTLVDPTLELHDANGSLIANNDDWQQDGEASQIPAGLQPLDVRESALHRSLASGAYTAIVQGKDSSTGVALVEVYYLSTP